jgi:hypothetical protein
MKSLRDFILEIDDENPAGLSKENQTDLKGLVTFKSVGTEHPWFTTPLSPAMAIFLPSSVTPSGP